ALPGAHRRRRLGRDARAQADLRDLRRAGLRDAGAGGVAASSHARDRRRAVRRRHLDDALRRVQEAREAPPHRQGTGVLRERLGRVARRTEARHEGSIEVAEARTMEKSELEAKNVAELQEIAGALGVEGLKNLRKGELIDAIIKAGNGAGAAGDNGGAVVTEERAETTEAERPDRGDRGERQE